MPNTVGPDGIEIQTVAEILAEIKDGTLDYSGMYAIYGPDINLEPNSPDGQFINITAQAKRDMLELINSIAASFDPDQAVGVLLDQRCAINGVVRRAGVFCSIVVTIVVSQNLTLTGLDADDNPDAFTISNAAGTLFRLVDTTALTTGSNTATFRSVDYGPFDIPPNTLTTIVTPTLGVTSVNNVAAPIVDGSSEETDFELRLRRQRSVSLPAQGFLEGLIAGLLNTEDVTQVAIYENNTGVTDGDGIPGHSIWVIVLGGTDEEVAQTIYNYRNAGCGMFGAEVVAVEQVDGTTFDIKFDRPTEEDLWIEFDVEQVEGAIAPDEDYIRQQLVDLLTYQINQPANTTDIIALINQIDPNASVSNEGVSNDDITYETLLATSAKDRIWSVAAARIRINGLIPS